MKIRMQCLVAGLLALSLGEVAVGQEKFASIQGKVTTPSGEPVPYAHIYLKDRGVGTASNQQGEFVFKIREDMLPGTLVVSCIGYQPVNRQVSETATTLTIVMEPAVVELAELVVSAQSGLELLKKVLEKIPENYDTSAVQLTAFYRENIHLGDFELSHTEAVLDIYRTFKVEKDLNDQIRVIKGRKKEINFGSDGQFYYWMSGISNGARGSLSEDMVKYHNARNSPFNPKNFRYYEYDCTDVIREGDRNLIVLDVIPKQHRKAIIKMKVFIEEESLAIVRHDFELSEAGVRYVSRKDKGIAYSIMSKVVGARSEYHKFQYSIAFKEYGSKWYLNSVRRHWEILVNSEKRNMVDEVWNADMDLIVTDVDTINVRPIGEGNIGNTEDSMGRLIGNDYDEAFWENYNILKPVLSDSVRIVTPDTLTTRKVTPRISNRQNGFTRADTLRGKLTPLRTCYDVTFYHLDVAVDLEDRSVKGSNRMRFNVVEPFTRFQIDLYSNMTIDQILYHNQSLSFTREYDAVYVTFPKELRAGDTEEVTIYYGGVPKTPDWSIPMNGGVLWDKDSLGNIWAQVVCQGSGASLWWPNKDHLSDEPDSMSIWITVPSGYTEISNGRLIRKTMMPNDQTRYEWYVSYPINNYNVTFSIGKYAHYSDAYITADTLTIDYYVMPYNLKRSKKVFGLVKPMLEAYEKNFGKYPFSRDGFMLVESLYPMEHQSGVCIGKITAENAIETNPLIWHEAAHEWWGNAISCTDMADLWIHEAFATYAEAMVVEHIYGKEDGSLFINENQASVRNAEPIVGVYDVNHIYYEIGDMYSKGSLMLHTFRSMLDNDEQWVAVLHAIQEHFRYKTLTTDQLINFINLQTKKDYTWFFDQYLRYSTLPVLEVITTEKENGTLLRYRWNAEVKNFAMPVRVTLAPDQFGLIYPTTEWKTMTIRDVKPGEFEVDEDHFLIDVELID